MHSAFSLSVSLTLCSHHFFNERAMLPGEMALKIAINICSFILFIIHIAWMICIYICVCRCLCLYMYYANDTCMWIHICTYMQVHVCLIKHVNVCVDIYLCVYICKHVNVSVCLFHQLLSANCVLQAMYKGEVLLVFDFCFNLFPINL